MADQHQPSPALEGKYQVVGIVPGEVETRKEGRVDLRTIDVETADRLVAGGFPYLRKVTADREPAAAEAGAPDAEAGAEAPASNGAEAPTGDGAGTPASKPATPRRPRQ